MDSLVHPRERAYFLLCLAVSAAVYGLLIVWMVGEFYVALAVLALAAAHGLVIGGLKGNGVRVSERQFPEVHRQVQRLALRMGLAVMPEVYVLQAGGLLSAFATRYLGRNFVVVHADMLELAHANGEPALGFLMARELAHIRQGHTALRPLLYPAMLVPFLGAAYARACEYTCDAIGAQCRPDGAADGLRVLAAGKHLYADVDVKELLLQAGQERDLWTWLAEVVSTHPLLPNRLAALPEMARAAGATRSPPAQVPAAPGLIP
jgi:Zn-dependent protease with chaperone function